MPNNRFLRNQRVNNMLGFSLLEMVVSLGIMAIMMVLLTNIMIISLSVAAKTAGRGNVREELSETLERIKKDIRNSDALTACESDSCTISIGGTYQWKSCDNENGTKAVCKYDAGNELVEKTSDFINIDKLFFDVVFDKSDTRKTVLVTIVGSHSNPSLNVKNVVLQTSVSTRNYTYGD